jgi:TonB family protein
MGDMYDAVSHALHARNHEPEGLKKTLLVSSAAHVLLMLCASIAPASWWQRTHEAPRDVMTISLGPSAPGADTGGMTSIGARPVQQVVQNAPTAQPTRRPATATSEMTLPQEKPRVALKPITGSDLRSGNAVAETGANTNSIGLSSRTGGTDGQFNIGAFCCPEYIALMFQRIHQNWNARQGSGGITTMKFTIQRDGTLTDIQMVRSSSNQTLDFLAQRALLAIRQLPMLPEAYPHPTLVINLDFEYQR